MNKKTRKTPHPIGTFHTLSLSNLVDVVCYFNGKYSVRIDGFASAMFKNFSDAYDYAVELANRLDDEARSELIEQQEIADWLDSQK